MASCFAVVSKYSSHLQHCIKYTLSAFINVNKRSFCTNFHQNSNNNTNDVKDNKDWIEAPSLPCFLTQFDALESFQIWGKKQWFATKDFKKNPEKYIHVIHKYYVPYWHFDALARSRYHAAIKSDGPCIRENNTSCTYSSSQSEMQIIANNRLTSDESKFLSIPLGRTQFQRMTHHKDDVLPDTVNEHQATSQVQEWLKTAENNRVHKLVKDDGMFKPKIESYIEHQCRKAYMPCFLIYFSSTNKNPQDKPNAISDIIPIEAEKRCIVHGLNGDIQGPKIYEFISCTKLTLSLTMLTIIPIGSLVYLPLFNISAFSVFLGLISSGIMSKTPLFTNRLKKINGRSLNTSSNRLKQQQMEEKEVEDILKAAEESWGSYKHRSRPIARGQERTYKEQYERYDYTATETVQEPFGYDADGRPKGRRALRYIELYEILGVNPNASTREIQQAFTKLAKVYHPDTSHSLSSKEREDGQQYFQKILLAFQVLKDPERRKKYDTTGHTKEEKKRNKPSSNTDNGNQGKS